MLGLGLRLGLFGQRENTESCSVSGCVKAAKGSSRLPKGFLWEHFLMGQGADVCVF